MANEKLSWLKRNRVDLFKGLTAVTLVVVAVMGWHWTDTANRSFWSTFWVVAALACLVTFAGFWAYYWTNDKPRK